MAVQARTKLMPTASPLANSNSDWNAYSPEKSVANHRFPSQSSQATRPLVSFTHVVPISMLVPVANPRNQSRLRGYKPNGEHTQIRNIRDQQVGAAGKSHGSSGPNDGFLFLAHCILLRPCCPTAQGQCQCGHDGENRVVMIEVGPRLREEVEPDENPAELCDAEGIM